MSLVSLGWNTPIPYPPGLPVSTTVAFAATTLDADAEYAGMVVRAPKAGTIKKINIPIGAVTTGATLDVTIEGVSATTGGPDGTPLTNGTTTLVVTTGDANTTMQATFSTGPTVTKGQLIAVRIANDATPGNLVINVNITSTIFTPYQFPYRVTGLPALSKSAQWPTLGLEYSDGSYAHIPGVCPLSVPSTSITVASNTTPDEYGLKFKLPAPVKMSGIWVLMVQNTNATCDVVLYDSDGSTPLKTLTLDADQVVSTGQGLFNFLFDDDITLAADTFYRVVLKPTTTNSVIPRHLTVPSAAAMDALEGGQNFHRTQRTDAGAWGDETTERPWMGVLISAVDDGAGGGGGAGMLWRSQGVNT
jgi:hypothetical protein